MENTLSDATATPSASATPDFVQALFAPASAEPVPTIPEPVPDDSGVPAPVLTETAAEQPVVAEPASPEAPVPTETQPDPEVERLRREVAEMRQAQDDAKRVAEQAERQAQVLQSREDYWKEVDRIAEGIDDADEQRAYYRKAANDLTEQEAQAVAQNAELRDFQQAIRNFPAFAQQNHGITPEQAATLTAYASDPNPQVAALKVATALEVFMTANASNKPTVSPETTREAVQQSLAERAAAEAAQSGVTAQGGINGANPPSITNQAPTSIRPGSRESFDLLDLALSQLR